MIWGSSIFRNSHIRMVWYWVFMFDIAFTIPHRMVQSTTNFTFPIYFVIGMQISNVDTKTWYALNWELYTKYIPKKDYYVYFRDIHFRYKDFHSPPDSMSMYSERDGERHYAHLYREGRYPCRKQVFPYLWGSVMVSRRVSVRYQNGHIFATKQPNQPTNLSKYLGPSTNQHPTKQPSSTRHLAAPAAGAKVMARARHL